MKLIQQLLEIAATGEGRYASARDINAKMKKNVRCESCNQPMSSDSLYNVSGKRICKKCKDAK